MSKHHSRYPPPSGGAGAAVSESRTPLRDNLESIALAILLVLMVRQVVVEAFKIPTGSMAPTLLGVHKEVRCPNDGWTFRVAHDKADGDIECPNCHYRWPGASMYYTGRHGRERIHFRWPAWLWHHGTTAISQRTVAGMDAANRVNRWGSRIFVNKFIYRLRQPRRWEVAVFRYPFVEARHPACGWEGELPEDGPLECPVDGSTNLEVSQKNYVKRLVGLPAETILLRGGNVYVRREHEEEFRIARKPPGIQKGLWIPVFDSSYVPRQLIRPRWEFHERTDRWQEDPNTGALSSDAIGTEMPLFARFARPIRDLYAYNGTHMGRRNEFSVGEPHPMGDLRLQLDFSLSAAPPDPEARVLLRLRNNQGEFTLSLPTDGSEAVLRQDGNEVARASVPVFPPDARQRASLAHYDARAEARLDGKVLMDYEYAPDAATGQPRQEVAFGARGAQVTFHRTRIHRDVYYIPHGGHGGTEARYEMDADSYMVLGDNSPASSDSRAWPDPRVPAANLMGLAFGEFWPIHDINLLSIGSEPQTKGRR